MDILGDICFSLIRTDEMITSVFESLSTNCSVFRNYRILPSFILYLLSINNITIHSGWLVNCTTDSIPSSYHICNYKKNGVDQESQGPYLPL